MAGRLNPSYRLGTTATSPQVRAGLERLRDLARVWGQPDALHLVGAVREGRGIYDNIVKFVRFQLSTALGLDPVQLAESKMVLNARKYPVDLSRGNAKKADAP